MVTNPYPGLRPFEEADAHLFFGRKQAVKELLALLKEHRFLAVLGLSGSGKSSLIRAGLLPAMHLGGMGDDFADWRVATFQPGMDPIGSLSAALDDPKVLGPDPDGRSLLERSSRGLAERTLRASLADGSYLLVFVDQFEEIFRFQKERARGPNEAALFVRLLLEASQAEWSRVHVLITMRSDFLGECSQFSGLPEALGRCQYLVRGMTADQRAEAIEQPAQQAHIEVTPQLVQQVLNDAGDDPARLPVMQHALMRTCALGTPGPLTLEHYNKAGTMDDALDQHAQTIFNELDEADKRVTRRMFRCLAERRSGARDTRRPTTVNNIAAVSGVSQDQVKRIYRHFSSDCKTFLTHRNSHLSRTASGRRQSGSGDLSAESLIDVTHESLLHLWKPLTKWIDQEEELGRRFTTLAEEWLKDPNDLLAGGPLVRAKEWLECVQVDLPDALPEQKKVDALEAWATRYPVRYGETEKPVAFSSVKDLIERSDAAENAALAQRQRQQVRQRYLVRALIAMIIVVGLSTLAYTRTNAKNRELDAKNLELQELTHQKEEAARQAQEGESNARRAQEEAEHLRKKALAQRDAEAGLRYEKEAATARATRALQETKKALADTEAARSQERLALEQAKDEREKALSALDRAEQERKRTEEERRRGVSRLLLARSDTLRTQRASLVPISLAVGLAGIQYADADPELLKQASEAWRRPPFTFLPRMAHRASLSTAQGRILVAAFSQNGDELATATPGSSSTSGSRQITLTLWDQQGTQVRAVQLERSPSRLIFSPDGNYLAAITQDRITLWDTKTGTLNEAVHNKPVNAVAFSRDSMVFASGSDDQRACVWKSSNAEQVRCIEHPGNEYVTSLDFGLDAQRLVTGTDENVVRMWNLGNGQLMWEAKHGGRVNVVRFSPNGAIVASASDDKTVQLRTPADGRATIQLIHSATVAASQIEFNPNSGSIATVGSDNVVRLWSVTGRLIANLTHENRIQGITFSSDGQLVATASADNTGRVWDANRGGENWRAVHDGSVLGIRVLPDGRSFTTVSTDRTARRWEIPGGPELVRPIEGGVDRAAFGGSDWLATIGSDRDLRILALASSGTIQVKGPFRLLAFSRNARKVASVTTTRTGSNEIHVFDVSGKEPIRKFPLKASPRAMAFDSEGKRLAVSIGGTATIWDVESGKESPFTMTHANDVNAISFSPEGPFVSTGGNDGLAKVWDVNNGTLLAALQHPGSEYVIALEFSSDGTRLGTGTDENNARVWDWKEQKPVRSFGHSDSVVAVAFDSAGKRLATASDDNTARVWAIATGEEIRRLSLASPVRAVRFAAEDMKLNTVNLNGAVGTWNLQSENLMEEACKKLPRNLTPEEWKTHIGTEPSYEKTCKSLP